jgi:hypothetical protein
MVAERVEVEVDRLLDVPLHVGDGVAARDAAGQVGDVDPPSFDFSMTTAYFIGQKGSGFDSASRMSVGERNPDPNAIQLSATPRHHWT